MSQPDESVMIKSLGSTYWSWRQYQEKTYWCWNATTVSIANFYANARAWTQCGFATAVLNRKDSRLAAQQPFQCCPDGALRGDCNQGWWPDAGPLQQAGVYVPAPEDVRNYVDWVEAPGWVQVRRFPALTKNEVKAEIDAGRPIMMNIGWGGNLSGHIVNIWGYSYRPETGELVHVWVHDPWQGTHGTYAGQENDPIMWVAWETLFGGYPGGPNGTWNRTFKTRRN
ncbi:C39 family peptidase [Microbispora sp. NPDC049633]|uniref:C39 family peptidase n=1 Tax=Microbispora sp. NPDC049633 TaxID=3154355 RepID=UPI0034270716